jgi:hypothetical protein
VQAKKEPQEIRVQDFVQKIEKAESWDFHWAKSEDKVFLMTDGDETVYVTPDLKTVSQHDFDWFISRIEGLTNAMTAESEGKGAGA